MEEKKKQIVDLIVEIDGENSRVDKYLSEQDLELSRSYLQKLLKEGCILVSGVQVKSNYRLKCGEEIRIEVPPPKDLNIEPEQLPLDIIYEDDDIIVVNKAKGMVVHPAAGHYTGTLVNGLMYHCKDNLSGINGIMRPGIVHRIDRDTTGVLVVCKNDKAHNFIAEQLKCHSITRKYYAVVCGIFREVIGSVDAPIGRHPIDRKKMAVNLKNGKRAVTHYKVLEQFGTKYSLIECQLETGRTHQIRVHMSSIHHPLVGDSVYNPLKQQISFEGQALHAKTLGFIHPSTKEYVEFTAPLPEDYCQLLEKLRRL